MMASVMNMKMQMMTMMVADSYDNEEDCKDDYVESEQQIMKVGGLCIYAASRLPCGVTVCACNYAPKLQYITVWGEGGFISEKP